MRSVPQSKTPQVIAAFCICVGDPVADGGIRRDMQHQLSGAQMHQDPLSTCGKQGQGMFNIC
jgi:hypothetical protein